MILAEDEVAIGTDHDGIMVLDDALAAGTPLADVLPIATDVLEVEITPNRPDCLGVYGVAREVHAATDTPLAPAPWADDPHPGGDSIPGFSVEVAGARPVPALHGAAVRGRRLGPSPLWLKARLMAAGQRPINNVVDITNYVMLLTGQPMHAFDADLRRRRPAGGAARPRRREDDHARRHRAHARRRHVRDRRRRRPDLDRRDHGRRPLRGARRRRRAC